MTKLKKTFENRAFELDVLRGIAVLLMVVDHFLFDLWGLLPGFFADYPRALRVFAVWYWTWDVRIVVRYAVIFVFFALTGICSSFSRSNLKRGGKLFAVAMLVTAGTYVVGRIAGDINITIVFGVLHAIALSLLLIGLIELLHPGKWVYLILGLVLIAVGACFSVGNDGTLTYYYSEPFFPLLGKAILGMAQCGSDCFPLPSTMGQICIGMFLGKQFYPQRKSLFGRKYRRDPLAFMGRHSLILYFAHQVLLPVLAAVVLVAMGYTLAF